MDNPTSDSGTGTGETSSDDIGAGPHPGSTECTPRWVKVFAIIALVVVLLLAVIMLTGGAGGHGPGRHTGGGGGDTPPSSVTEHRPSEGGHTP